MGNGFESSVIKLLTPIDLLDSYWSSINLLKNELKRGLIIQRLQSTMLQSKSQLIQISRKSLEYDYKSITSIFAFACDHRVDVQNDQEDDFSQKEHNTVNFSRMYGNKVIIEWMSAINLEIGRRIWLYFVRSGQIIIQRVIATLKWCSSIT